MTYKVITDLEELDLLWRAGVLYVDCGSPDEKKQWALDIEKEIPVSVHVQGWTLLDCGTWKAAVATEGGGRYFRYNTWAVLLED